MEGVKRFYLPPPPPPPTLSVAFVQWTECVRANKRLLYFNDHSLGRENRKNFIFFPTT